MRWDDHNKDPWQDLQRFLIPYAPSFPPALIVPATLTDDERQKLPKFFVGHSPTPDVEVTSAEVRAVMIRPRMIRVPVEPFGRGQGLELAWLARMID